MAISTTPLLEIHLLGQPRFAFGRDPFKFASLPKALPLLAYLALHRQRPISREKAAFTLWEDDSEDGARANLRRHLYHMQRALPPTPPDTPWIIADAESIQWNPAANASLDVGDFERLAASQSSAAEAVEIYGGELLDGFYDEWLYPERDRLGNLYVSLLSDLVLRCRGERDLGRAAAYAQRILTHDPWREDTIRQLMAVRYEAGDRAGALAVYQQFDRRLREEMNVDPMPETASLRDIILRDEPLPAIAGSSSVASDAAGSPLLPFVGRESEIDQLRMLWSRAARGRGCVVLIGGEAGIGKSRLAAEFALIAEAQGARVMTGATAYPESTPFQAIAEALRSAAPLLSSLTVPTIWLGVAAQAVPELRARIADLPTPPKVEPERERARLFEAFSTCLEALATPRPLVVVLEDMHWAGQASIAALEFLGRRLSKHAVLVIATYREEEAPRAHPLRRMRRALQEEHILSTVTPRHLGREAVTNLMSRTPSLAARPAEFADVLLERSAGNPLFLNEVIRAFSEQKGFDSAQPPSSATQAIAMRVARLPETSRMLAEVAAIVGQGFDVDLVRDVTGWNENEVLDALSDLIDRHIVKDTGGRSGYAYAFAHHVVQSTIYAGVPEDIRVRRHRRVARVLGESFTDRPGRFAADVARHFDLGKEPDNAAAAYLEAGRQANDVYAYDEALAFIKKALELATDSGNRREALSIRETIGAKRGDRGAQLADLESLARMAAESGDVRFACDVLRRRALLARAVGEREEERSLAEEFFSLAKASGDPRALADSLIALAAYWALTGDHAGGKRAAEDALGLYRRTDDATGQIEARCRLIEFASEGGGFEAALAMLTEVRESAQAAGNQRLIARAFTSATHAAIVDQRYAACRELALEARELYRTIGDREGEADVIVRQAQAAARLSMLDEARGCYEEAAAIYEAIGKRLGAAAVLANGGIFSVRLGLLDKAEASLSAALEQFRALKDVRGQTACGVNISYVRLLRGDAAEAKRLAADALQLARSMPHAAYEAAALANLGLAERDLGDLTSAIEHMEAGLAIRQRLSEPVDFADDLAHLAFVFVLAGKNDSAKKLLDELTATPDATSSMVFMPQYAYWVAAQAYRALGERKRTKMMLNRAHDVVTEQAAAITSAADRRSFLALEVNVQIESAFKKKQWSTERTA